MDPTISDPGDGFIHVDVFGAEPGKPVDLEVRSKAVAPNQSTEGITAAVQNVPGATGTVHYRVPRDFLLPDVPRTVSVRGTLVEETFTT